MPKFFVVLLALSFLACSSGPTLRGEKSQLEWNEGVLKRYHGIVGEDKEAAARRMAASAVRANENSREIHALLECLGALEERLEASRQSQRQKEKKEEERRYSLPADVRQCVLIVDQAYLEIDVQRLTNYVRCLTVEKVIKKHAARKSSNLLPHGNCRKYSDFLIYYAPSTLKCPIG